MYTQVHPREGRTARLAFLTALWIKIPVRITLLILVLLSFIEQPAWCAGHVPAPEYYLMSGMAVLGVPVMLSLDWLGISILYFELGLIITYQGFHRWRRGRGKGAASLPYAAVLLLQLLDVVVATSVWLAIGENALHPMRFAPFLRLLLLIIQSEQLRLQFVLVNRTLPALASVGAVLVAFLFIFAWAALLVFEKTKEGRAYFQTLPEAAWQLLIALTTANFPDVMMPAYRAKSGRITVLFFAAFEVGGTLFLLNLITAVVYKAHSDTVKARITYLKRVQHHALSSAFELLDPLGSGRLKREDVMQVKKALPTTYLLTALSRICRYLRIRFLPLYRPAFHRLASSCRVSGGTALLPICPTAHHPVSYRSAS